MEFTDEIRNAKRGSSPTVREGSLTRKTLGEFTDEIRNAKRGSSPTVWEGSLAMLGRYKKPGNHETSTPRDHHCPDAIQVASSSLWSGTLTIMNSRSPI
jgi:hypothetical protein